VVLRAASDADAEPDREWIALASRLADRPLEIDARNGVIVRLGERAGIPTPLNAMAVAILEASVAIDPTGAARHLGSRM
jgi:Ketopantoate reductase PanE/ApbA C terminal